MDSKENSDNNEENNSSINKNKRARSAIGDRNYKCGCNKAYLSYPALYTHVKNKHKGVFPIGSHSKKKLPIAQLEEKNETLDIDNNQLLENFFSFLKEVNCYKENVENDKKSYKYLMNNLDDNFIKENKIFKIFETSFMNYYNFAKNLKDIFKDFVKKYCHKDESSDNLIINTKKIKENINNLNIYEVFCHFIIETFKYVEFKFFKEFVYIMIIYMHTLNDKGYDFLYSKLDKNEIKKRDKDKDKVQFCLLNELSIISESSNIFIAENFYEEYVRIIKDKENCYYFGDEESQIYNLIQTTKYFINWLFINDYTEYKAELNIDI